VLCIHKAGAASYFARLLSELAAHTGYSDQLDDVGNASPGDDR